MVKFRKKTKERFLVGIFMLAIITVAISVYLNLNFLRELIGELVMDFGYIGILVFSFITDLFIQPFGPEAPASIGVLFNLNIVLVVIFALIGSYSASFINFYIGKGYLKIKAHKLKENEIESKHVRLFKKYGVYGLLLAAISPVPWVPFCWMAGAYKIKIKDFIIFGLIPRLFKIIVIVWVVKYLQILLV